jgi:hypothetical protein
MGKSLKRVENLERYVIFSCYYLLILLIKRFLFCCVHSLIRFVVPGNKSGIALLVLGGEDTPGMIDPVL